MEETRKTGVAPFVLGLLSVLCMFIPIAGTIVAIVFGIVALVMTVNARKTTNNAFLTAAYVLSIIGIALAGLQLLFGLIVLGFASSVAGGLMGSIAEFIPYL